MPGTFALPAGPASPAAARARPQPPPRACRTPRPRQCQVRRACREAGPPPGAAELNRSGLGGPAGVPDRVRNTKLTYPIPPRISPRHAARLTAGRRAEPLGAPRGRVAAGPASGQTAGRRKHRRAPALQNVPSGLSHASPSTSAQPSRTAGRCAVIWGVGGASQQSRHGLLDDRLFRKAIHRHLWGEYPHLPRGVRAAWHKLRARSLRLGWHHRVK